MGFRVRFLKSNTISGLDTLVTNELKFTELITDFRLNNINSTPGEYIVAVTRLAINMASTVFVGSGLDDGTYSGTYSGAEDAEYVVEIDATGTPDTFKWKKITALDPTPTDTTGVSITGSAQLLDDGVSITFAATTGHALVDLWKVQVEIES